MKSREQERLNRAENAMFAATVAEIENGILALQSTDTPGMEELSRKLFLRLEAFREREAQQKERWGELTTIDESIGQSDGASHRAGLRHYLNGGPVHAGTELVLQHVTFRADDYGQYSVPLKDGTAVRYEANYHSGRVLFSLFTSVGGHEFAAVGEPWMRFRWPERR
jgi:hypothetical protein